MEPIFIAKLTGIKVEVLEAIPLNKEFNGRIMVKILDIGFIYYEKVENIASTRDRALGILQNKIEILTKQVEELWNKNEL